MQILVDLRMAVFLHTGFIDTTMAKFYYPKNQHTYEALEEVKMKDPTTGEWKDAYLYTEVLPTGLHKGMYVREKEDFLNKFQAVSN